MPIALSISGLRSALSKLARFKATLKDAATSNTRFGAELTPKVNAFAQSIASQAAHDMRGTVPVRTGLLRSKTSKRSLQVYSDAMNSRGVEYAQFVDGYFRALNRAHRLTEQRIASRTFRTNLYATILGRTVGIPYKLEASRVVFVRSEGTRLIIEVRS